jgi:hypothetical protein
MGEGQATLRQNDQELFCPLKRTIYNPGVESVLKDIPVMHIISVSGPSGAAEAFKKIEEALHWQLKGRKFYGAVLEGRYRACAAKNDGDDSEKLGLQSWVIPGGKYLKSKIADWEEHIPETGPAFDKMVKNAEVDLARPFIAFYRSRQELQLYVPIRQSLLDITAGSTCIISHEQGTKKCSAFENAPHFSHSRNVSCLRHSGSRSWEMRLRYKPACRRVLPGSVRDPRFGRRPGYYRIHPGSCRLE